MIFQNWKHDILHLKTCLPDIIYIERFRFEFWEINLTSSGYNLPEAPTLKVSGKIQSFDTLHYCKQKHTTLHERIPQKRNLLPVLPTENLRGPQLVK